MDLEEVDTNLFVAPSENLWVPAGGVGVFGGQVIGQALHAASLTVERPDFQLHSLHAYFLRFILFECDYMHDLILYVTKAW